VGNWAGCVLASKAIDLDRDRIRKLRGETVPEFVQNSEGRVDFELRTCIRKKRHAEPEASAAIQASI
jgi:hypothetical protein